MKALAEHLSKCEPCRVNSFIIEFEELPEDEKIKLKHYDKATDFLLYCKECKIYKILPEKVSPCEKAHKPDL